MLKGNMLQLCSLVDRKWKVLIVDYDLTRLEMLEEMLHTCNFDVTKCRKAKEAISMLQEDQNRFDIVITDLYLPDMDGFEILKRIGSDMDLPIIMALDDDDNEDLIRKGLIYGACDYLVKPICIENIKHLWKHVFRKQRHEGLIKEMEQSGSSSSDLINNNNNNVNNNESNTSNKFPQNGSATTASISDGEEHEKCVKKRKFTTNTNTSTNTLGDAQVKDDATTKRKKQRVIWTPELHAKFVAAVNQFGTSRAVPKKILEIMNIPGLTRENVASHLQKYRQYHKRLEQLQHPSKNDTKSSPMNHDGFQTQIIPSSSSSSLQLRDFTGLNSHPQTHDFTHDHGAYYNEQYGHQHNIQMTLGDIKTSEANMNLRVVHHVESGNVIFPIASYTHRSTIGSKVHVVETPWNEMGLNNNNYINGEINSIGAQPNGYEFASQRVIDAYENYAPFDLGYNDATLYMEQ